MADILERLKGNGEPWTFAEIIEEIETLRIKTSNARIVVKAAAKAIDVAKTALRQIATEHTTYTTGEDHARAIQIASEALQALEPPKEKEG